jgi:RNA polymerase sigma-70 factor (ECF subfamily)
MDEITFLRLIEAHQDILYKICRVYRNTPEDRRDLFQEIVFRLWKSVPGFRGQSAFSTWMYRVALTTAIAGFRRPAPLIRYTGTVPEPPGETGEAEGQREALFRAIEALTPAEKALITLYLEDLSYREIAEITGISENNVGVKLNRIRRKLEQLLKRPS